MSYTYLQTVSTNVNSQKKSSVIPKTTGVRCPKLVAPEYGTIQLDDTVYGSRVQYTCNRGYELYGIEYRTCGYNGKWSGMEPTCKRKRNNVYYVTYTY